MSHIETLRTAGLSFIADRIEFHDGDIQAFWDKELFVQPTLPGTMGAALNDWLGKMGHEGDLHQRLTAFFEKDVPDYIHQSKAPMPTSVSRINPEGRKDHRGHMVFTMDQLTPDGQVVSVVPANGLLRDAEGVPLARFRNGRRQYFGHMDLEYREAQS